MLDKRFAVIDLETTGNNKTQDRILQLSVVFVEHLEIVDEYTTFLSDAKSMTPFIEELTQINLSMVKHAPKFKDIADTLYELLKDTVIVAHNVMFDLGFLQKEFKALGIDFKPVATLDTVEMSRILYPTLGKFQLNEVSSYLNINLDNPHRADEDAKATAQLLIHSINRLRRLDYRVIEKLLVESPYLQYDFHELLTSIYKRSDKQHDSSLMEISGLCVRKHELTDIRTTDVDVEEAYRMFIEHHDLSPRSAQVQLIKDILNALMTDTHNAIEAYTGMGKTAAYLIASLIYYAETKNPVVITTSKKILQNELYLNELKRVTDALNININVTSLKGRDNYIDLETVNYLYYYPSTNYEIVLLKMKILIWLTETITGDISEIHLKGSERMYYMIAKVQSSHKSNQFHFKRNKSIADNSAIVFTNHYYIEEVLEEMNHIEDVIVDEGHLFVESIKSKYRTSVTLQQLKFLINQIGTLQDERLLYRFNVMNDNLSIYLLEDIIEKLNEGIEHIFKYAYKKDDGRLIKTLNENIQYAKLFLKTIQGKPDYQVLYNHLNYYNEILESILKAVIDSNLKVKRGKAYQHTKVIIDKYDDSEYSDFIQNLKCLIVMSGTLEINDSFKHLSNLFGNEEFQTKVYSNEDLYKDTKLFIPNDMPELNDVDNYVRVMVEYISLYMTEREQKLIVLFSNYEQLDLAFDYYTELSSLKHIPAIKQSKNLNAHKLLNSFNQLSLCVLFATDSFIEGINFNIADERLIMMSKLPFPVPEDNDIKRFYREDVPRTVFKFRQLLGRINRGNDESGIIVLFDERILSKNYKNSFLKYIPEENVINGSYDTFKQLITDL